MTIQPQSITLITINPTQSFKWVYLRKITYPLNLHISLLRTMRLITSKQLVAAGSLSIHSVFLKYTPT